jgi:hypothetical protein
VAATLWLAGPVVTLSLWLLERLPSPRPVLAFGGRKDALVSISIAVLVGVALALIALPFYQATYGGVATTGVAGVLTNALVDEVLLRLFLVTAVAWLCCRELGLGTTRAAAMAIGVAAVVQVLVYLPGVLAIGFPSVGSAVGFMAVTVLVPAVAFGVLYWQRGFSSALLAHATTLAALMVIAGA